MSCVCLLNTQCKASLATNLPLLEFWLRYTFLSVSFFFFFVLFLIAMFSFILRNCVVLVIYHDADFIKYKLINTYRAILIPCSSVLVWLHSSQYVFIILEFLAGLVNCISVYWKIPGLIGVNWISRNCYLPVSHVLWQLFTLNWLHFGFVAQTGCAQTRIIHISCKWMDVLTLNP